MSGFVALYHPDGRPVIPSLLDKMTTTIAHRGMDGSGLWHEDQVGLGHRMRWTTPESLNESLPLYDPIRRLAITADARIDNRDELTVALDVADRTITDSALILLAYERWGEASSEKLLGDFAFVLWDGRRRMLFGARDHLGVKPFFYSYQSGRLFACASEIKALLCMPGVPRRLNEMRVADYLLTNLDDKANTFYKDIHRLPPGHRIIVESRKLTIQPYWTLDPERTLELKSDEEYAETFREIFTDAVRVRMRSAFPVGSLLSGGLDSSSISCIARLLKKEAHTGSLPTFSAVFDDMPSCDERTYIQAVLDQQGQGEIEAHFLRADLLSPMTDLDAMLWHQDEPFFAPNLYMHWGLYGAARKCGARVLLDGFEGDTTVSHGEDRLIELTRSWEWATLAREMVAIRHQVGSRWQGALRSYVIAPILPRPVRLIARFLRERLAGQTKTHFILSPEFSRRVGLADRIQAVEEHGKWAHTNREEHFKRLNHGVIPLFHEVADLAATAFSIEPRYPFADKRLVEYCLALPPVQKRSQGWGRVVLRRAMAEILPETIRWRSGKSDLSANFSRRLLASDRSLLDEIILRFSDVISPYIEITTLRRVYERYSTAPNSPDALMVWKAASLGLWLRRGTVQV